MAHDVVGLDLGSSEVKAVVVRMALRGAEVVRCESEPVPLGKDGKSLWPDVLQAAKRLTKKLGLTAEATVHCAIQGELVSTRRMTVPSSAAKQLDQVLKFEVDEVIPFDVDDAVFDYIEIERTADQIGVVTAAALHAEVARRIEGLEEAGITPRELGVATLSYVLGVDTPADPDDILAIVDIGHERTNIAILDQTAPTVRTALRGGREITAKLAEVGGVDFSKAEALKQQYGLDGKVGEVLKDALKAQVREIQQTLKGHLASGGRAAKRILLCGGGGQLNGLATYLADELGLPVERFEPTLGALSAMKSADDNNRFFLAYALARRETTQRNKRIDLRQGDLAFRGDYEFVKRRIGGMGILALLVILAWIFASYAEYSVLSDRVAAQQAELSDRTKQLFGKPESDVERIKEKLSGQKAEQAPMPSKDAFDIVVELSRRIPPEVVHDVELLEIKPKRVTLRGTVDAELKAPELSEDVAGAKTPDAGTGTDLSPTDLIKQKLEAFSECFTAIRVGKVTAVEERRRYQMDIDSRCP
ncbi:MAG: pilus assembly protein PilM [Myxococcota bacterium]|nr:pilus assembly protein PilM [Myxococcota bacterium]